MSMIGHPDDAERLHVFCFREKKCYPGGWLVGFFHTLSLGSSLSADYCKKKEYVLVIVMGFFLATREII